MQTPLLPIICIVAAFAIAEAVPWHKRNPKQRSYNAEVESDNNGAADFSVGELGKNADGYENLSGGVLTQVDQNNENGGRGNGHRVGGQFQVGREIQEGREFQDGSGSYGKQNEKQNRGNKNSGDNSNGGLASGEQNNYNNQDVVEGTDEHGGIQVGRESQGGFADKGRENGGGWWRQTDYGFSGSRDNQRGREPVNIWKDGRVDYSDNEEDLYLTTPKNRKYTCRGCSWTNIGNGRQNTNSIYLYRH